MGRKREVNAILLIIAVNQGNMDITLSVYFKAMLYFVSG